MKMDRINPGLPPSEVPADEDREIALWMGERADRVSAFLKALSHEGRLMILCHLAGGEKSVTELEQLLGQRRRRSASSRHDCGWKGWSAPAATGRPSSTRSSIRG
jgi:hypothetical protein